MRTLCVIIEFLQNNSGMSFLFSGFMGNESEHGQTNRMNYEAAKRLAYGVSGPGFEPGSRHMDFRDWLFPASKSRYD